MQNIYIHTLITDIPVEFSELQVISPYEDRAHARLKTLDKIRNQGKESKIFCKLVFFETSSEKLFLF